MATKKRPEADASTEPAPENKAAHDSREYKQRMNAFSAQMPGGIGITASQPFFPSYPYMTHPGGMMHPGGMTHPGGMMHPGGMVHLGGMTQPPNVPHYPAPEYAPSKQLTGSGQSIFESIGKMIQLGIDALNMGLAGGTQMMQGFSGHGPGPFGPSPQSAGHFSSWGGCGYYGHPHGCCCEPHCCCCGCNPSVHNCY